MSRVDLEPVFVLHTRPFRNTSLLVELFSNQHGRISCVARSARGLKSQYRGKLMPFMPLQASWYGKKELKTLAEVEYLSAPKQLSRLGLACGFYLNELIMKLLHKEDPHPEVFLIYQTTLESIFDQVTQPTLETNLRLFEKTLLESIGYALSCHVDAEYQPIQPEQYYVFRPSEGFLLQAADNADLGFLGQHLLAIEQQDLSDSNVARTAKKILSLALQEALGGQTIKSRELLI